jgi:putative ABC transport system permease protein
MNVDPLVLHPGNWATVVAVKVDAADISGVVGKVSGVWKRFAPQQAIRYVWLEESFARMYADITRTQRMFTSFAVLAIVIACLGLFALSAFMAEQRRKEIGIRKVTERSEGYERGGAWRSSSDEVLGASVGQLAGLLSGDFLRLVLIAVVIASPIAWWGMHRWLMDYVYRVTMGVWVFVMAGGMVVVIALATISVQAIRAAVANPAPALRSE